MNGQAIGKNLAVAVAYRYAAPPSVQSQFCRTTPGEPERFYPTRLLPISVSPSDSFDFSCLVQDFDFRLSANNNLLHIADLTPPLLYIGLNRCKFSTFSPI
jgi:hypothetical protein